MSSEFNYLFAHFIQCLSRKLDSYDQASTIHVQMEYSLMKNRRIDRVKHIYEDVLSQIRLPKANSKKKDREVGVFYPRFLSRLLHNSLLKVNRYPEGNLSYSKIGSNPLI